MRRRLGRAPRPVRSTAPRTTAGARSRLRARRLPRVSSARNDCRRAAQGARDGRAAGRDRPSTYRRHRPTAGPRTRARRDLRTGTPGLLRRGVRRRTARAGSRRVRHSRSGDERRRLGRPDLCARVRPSPLDHASEFPGLPPRRQRVDRRWARPARRTGGSAVGAPARRSLQAGGVRSTPGVARARGRTRARRCLEARGSPARDRF